MRRAIGTAIVVLTCTAAGSAAAWAETGTAELRATGEDSTLAGRAVLTESPEGLHVTVQVIHAPPGKHAVHIHEFGKCDEAGNAAGGHFNPKSVGHGLTPADGVAKSHPGDMGNIEVGEEGKGMLGVMLPGVGLYNEYGVAGRAVVVHAREDDFSQPVGNAGDRIGCGPIVITKTLGAPRSQ
jgi:Cu-Zn family superoxide dismutase